MFNKVMTGGACQADGQQTGVNQNAFTNMVDNLLTGDAVAKQRAEANMMAAQNPQQQQNMREMQQQFDNIMANEMMAKQLN